MPIFNTLRIPALLQQSLAGIILIVSVISCAGPMRSHVGTPDDIQYAARLWSVLEREHMVGAQAKTLKPFIGAARPHGWVLEVESRTVRLGDHNGFVVVKKNYRGDHISVTDVENDRAKYLNSISVMFKREAAV